MIIERSRSGAGFRSGSAPRTTGSGSGSRRPKNIRNTAANIRPLFHNAELTPLLTSTWHQSEGRTESCPSAIISGPLATTSSTRPRAFCRMEMACWCEMLLSRTSTLKLRQYTTYLALDIYHQKRLVIRVGKNPVFFFKNPAQWFFWVFLGLLGFLGFFWVFCPDGRIFRVFFSFTNTFRCIQTLNYNHSY